MEFENVPENVYNGDEDTPIGENAEGNSDDKIKKPDIPEAADKGKRHKSKRLAKHGSREREILTGGIPPVNFVAPHRRWKNSRRSRNVQGRGLPKKGGAGGKGVWGQLGSELYEEEYEDQNDPNYDEVDDKNVELKEVIPAMTTEEFIKETEPIILEYFENGDTVEVACSIDEYLTDAMKPMVVYVAIEVAMDHKHSQCEMTSVLISDLYGRIITSKDIANGTYKLKKKQI